MNEIQKPSLYALALANIRLVRERIRKWQETHNIESEDSVDTLQTLREGRDDRLIRHYRK